MTTMRHIGAATRACGRLLFLLIPLLLTACAPKQGVHQVGNWGPKTFLEDGTLVTLYTRQLSNYTGPRLFRVSALEKHSHVLTEHAATWNKAGYDNTLNHDLFHQAPEWRREEALEAVARYVTADVPAHANRHIVSSHEPFVVAVSTGGGPDGFWTIGHMIQQLDTRPHTLYVLHGWPGKGIKGGPPEDRQIIELGGRKTLLELMREKPWERSGR